MRCLKLVKPYGQEAEEEEDDDEDGDASAKRSVLAKPRIIERDLLTQAYDIGQTLLELSLCTAAFRHTKSYNDNHKDTYNDS